jgi:hypothetical protein
MVRAVVKRQAAPQRLVMAARIAQLLVYWRNLGPARRAVAAFAEDNHIFWVGFGKHDRKIRPTPV